MLLLAEMSRSPRSSISPELRYARTPFTNDGDTQVFQHVAATICGMPGIVQYFSFSPKQAVVHPRVCPPHNCAQMVRHRVLSASRRLCLGSGSWEMQQLTQETWDYAPQERERLNLENGFVLTGSTRTSLHFHHSLDVPKRWTIVCSIFPSFPFLNVR